MAPDYDKDCCPEQQISHYNEARDRLEDAVEGIEHNLNLLRERLKPALTPLNPTPATDGAKNPTENAPMTQFLNNLCRRVGEANNALTDIFERLEF